MKRDTLSYRVLDAVGSLGPCEIQAVSMRLYGHVARHVPSMFANLRRTGLIECHRETNGGNTPGRWTLTELGRKVVADPHSYRESKGAAKPKSLAEARRLYARIHLEHVERQRKMGLSDDLIFEELGDRTSALGRGETS